MNRKLLNWTNDINVVKYFFKRIIYLNNLIFIMNNVSNYFNIIY